MPPGAPGNGGAAAGAGAGAEVCGEPKAGKEPVAAGGRRGISNTTGGDPCVEPMETVRRLTDCSTRSPSRCAPTANARGGLPSTAINATPAPSLLARACFGAMMPSSRNRDAASGAAARGAASAAGGAPRSRVRSPPAATSPTATPCGGAAGARTARRRTQNTAVAAIRAQITNADNRASMRRLSFNAFYRAGRIAGTNSP